MHPLQEQFAAQVEELVQAASRIARLRYVTSHGGNLSMRVSPNVVIITPTRVAKRDIAPGDICFVDMEGGTLFAEDGVSPTSEAPFHLRVLQKRPDLNAVVHAHPPLLTGFAIAGGDVLLKAYLPEPVIEVGPMVMVPYAQPGSDALAAAFEDKLPLSNGFLMENHGVLMTSNGGVMRALDLLEMMECTAQSVLVAMQLGGLKTLREEDVADLEAVMRARQLPMPGAPGHHKTLGDAFR